MPPKRAAAASANDAISKGNKRKLKSESESDQSDDDNFSPQKSKKSSNTKKAASASKGKKRKAELESDNDEESDEDMKKSGSDRSDEEGSGEDQSGDESGSNDEESGNDDSDEDAASGSDDEKKSKASAKKAAPKTKAKATKVKKEDKKVVKKAKTASSSRSKANKMPNKLERVTEASKAFLWWKAKELANGVNWESMEHPGINFAPPYVPHNIPVYYDGKPIQLDPEQEEIVSFYAALPLDGPQLGIPKTAAVFQKNFFDDFRATLTPGHEIKSFSKMNFDLIRAHLDKQKSLRKALTDEEKQAKKAEKEEITNRMNWCLIDGRIEKMGNYNMEPPGLFRGRGEHPKTGKLKSRCFSESVALNLSVDAPVPICALPGHAWKNVQHDPTVTWLCSWNENVQNQIKYVMLAASSSFKGKSDMDKYGKAIKLLSCIDKVRADYTAKIKQTKNRADRQMGTAMWVIDLLALRVGGEKGEDEADTVGCCSLRVEHFTFNPAPDSYEIELKFLGKDSMQYKQDIDFASYGDLGKLVYGCIKSFCKDKRPEDQVFDTLSPPELNRQLSDLMKGLTAKVFRTFNASVTLEKELPSAKELEGLSIQDKVVRYNAANRQVAILCNHQKTVSNAAQAMFETLNEKLKTLNEQRDELIKWKGFANNNKESKIPLKEDDKEIIDAINEKVQKALKKKEAAKTDQQKLDATDALEQAKNEAKLDQRRRFLEKHRFKTIPSVSSLEGRVAKWNEDIKKLETDIQNRDENKEVALGTSKINYMDPRISVAWCKRCEVPIDKVFAKTLRDKFNWAMAVEPDWEFK